MFLRKQDLINLAVDSGVIISSGLLLRHCLKVEDKWTISAEFKETKNEKGETVYIQVPCTKKLVDKETLEKISNFNIIANFIGKAVALYGVIAGSIMIGADISHAIEYRILDKRFDSYLDKFKTIIEDESLNEVQKQESVSCLRKEYGYTNLFEEHEKSSQVLIDAALETFKTADLKRLDTINKMLAELEKGKKEKYSELVEDNSDKIEAQVVSVQTLENVEEVKKEPAKQNIDTALEQKKPAVYDNA